MIEPLSEADRGGFLANVPELPGCRSDGDTRAEALAKVEDRDADLLRPQAGAAPASGGLRTGDSVWVLPRPRRAGRGRVRIVGADGSCLKVEPVREIEGPAG